MSESLEEVRRPTDRELEGFVRRAGDEFEALTVFHGLLAKVQSADAARAIVAERGLSSLAQRWYWRSRASGRWVVVVPQEVRPGLVRVAVGYYALPGVPTALITADDLAQGDVLTLDPPDARVHGVPGSAAMADDEG